MAKNDNTHSTSNARRRTASDRERRRDKVVNTVKERPYTAAALATVAAGAAAFFLTRGKSDKPLMKWAQEPQGDAGATDTRPSAAQAASLAASDTSTNAAATGGTGASFSPAAAMRATSASPDKTADAALDQSAKTETKVGAIAYGA